MCAACEGFPTDDFEDHGEDATWSILLVFFFGFDVQSPIRDSRLRLILDSIQKCRPMYKATHWFQRH